MPVARRNRGLRCPGRTEYPPQFMGCTSLGVKAVCSLRSPVALALSCGTPRPASRGHGLGDLEDPVWNTPRERRLRDLNAQLIPRDMDTGTEKSEFCLCMKSFAFGWGEGGSSRLHPDTLGGLSAQGSARAQGAQWARGPWGVTGSCPAALRPHGHRPAPSEPPWCVGGAEAEGILPWSAPWSWGGQVTRANSNLETPRAPGSHSC